MAGEANSGLDRRSADCEKSFLPQLFQPRHRERGLRFDAGQRQHYSPKTGLALRLMLFQK
jgi:hypothetical protein